MLFPTPRLTDRDQAVLAGIDEMRRKVGDWSRSGPVDCARWLSGQLTAEAVSGSNWIEGFRVPPNDVRDLMDGYRGVYVSDANRDETMAHVRMTTYVQALRGVDDFEYSKGLLNGLHWMLQGDRHSPMRPAGCWRSRPVHVVDASNPKVALYTAPEAAAIPGLMAEIVDWLNTDDGSHPLIRGAMAHLNLVSIHPWADGNGRMSRALQTLVIAREGLLAPEFSSVEAWLGRPFNTRAYYRELQSRGPAFQPDQDVSSWIRLHLLAHHHQIHSVWNRAGRSAEVRDLLVSVTGDRTVSALHEVAMTGRIRGSRFQRIPRDLRDLLKAGVLTPVVKSRASYYTEGPAFPERVLEVARTPMTLSEPYPDAVG